MAAVHAPPTAAAAANTALVTELARKAATFSHTAGTKVFQFEATFNAGEATGAITEAGVFNAASAGTMLDRVVFAVINKGADDAAGTGAVVDHDLLTETFSNFLSDQSRDDVGAAAGWLRNDQAYWFGWVRLREGADADT